MTSIYINSRKTIHSLRRLAIRAIGALGTLSLIATPGTGWGMPPEKVTAEHSADDRIARISDSIAHALRSAEAPSAVTGVIREAWIQHAGTPPGDMAAAINRLNLPESKMSAAIEGMSLASGMGRDEIIVLLVTNTYETGGYAPAYAQLQGLAQQFGPDVVAGALARFDTAAGGDDSDTDDQDGAADTPLLSLYDG